MIIAFYISGHGFGHATRSFEVIRALQRLAPDSRVIIRSDVPRWFVERSLGVSVTLSPAHTDTGIVQVDSIELDEEQTARQAGAFYERFDRRVSIEVAWLHEVNADIVVGDVPPLAFAAACAAGLPSIAIANFTWDWIYEIYPGFARLAPRAIPIIQRAYASTTLALRLPFAGGFDTMPAISDIPLIARRSVRERAGTRQALALDSHRPAVLVSFGGHGTHVPFERIVDESDITLIVTDHEAASAVAPAVADRLRRFSGDDLAARGLRYEDLVAAADCVVSKPGYGIVSECVANGVPLLYTSRGRFAEYDVMVDQMSKALCTEYIAQEDLRAGRWGAAIAALLAKPKVPARMALYGADVAANAIRDLANRRPRAASSPCSR